MTSKESSSHAPIAASSTYVVETDVLLEAEADQNALYNDEHLPGLASVPGTVRATEWSSRVRTSFRHTKRTMLRKIA